MLSSIKDSLASMAAKSVLAGRIERYGQLTDLRIRSRDKTIAAEVVLAGEAQEIRVEIGRYRVVSDGGGYAVVVETVTASREWLQLMLEDFVVGKSIPIPAMALMALGKPEA